MADSRQAPFEVSDFSAGITDDIFEQEYRASSELDNFIIKSDGKLESRQGSVIDNTDDDQAPSGVSRIGALINFSNNDKLFVNSGRQLFYRNPSNYSILRGPDNNEVLSAGDENDSVLFTQWNSHLFITNSAYSLPVKIFKDDAGTYQVRNNGFPFLSATPVITLGAAGENAYTYAAHWHYTYMVGNQEFQDFGPTSFVQALDAEAPDISNITISGLPTLSNGIEGNYDLANIKLYIYRTVSGGETFYKIGEVPHGTLSFVDNVSDDTAVADGIVLYTDDGTVDLEAPPLSKLVHIVNNTAYYGATKIGDEEFPYRVYQSVPTIPGGVPGDFFKDLEDEIVGISSTKSIPIVLCKKYIYRIEGAFDRFGRGGMNPVRISDTAGCVSALSVVQAENYIIWWGVDGIYASDGYQVFKISDRNNDRYRTILEAQTNYQRIYGTFNEKDRRVYWGCQRNSSNLDNDSLLVFDMRWGVQPKSTFTTWSGKSFRPTALAFYNGFLHRGDRRGYVLKHSSEYTTDPRIDILTDAADWSTETIIWTYKSVNINFGSTFARKMPTRILLQAANKANTTIQISAINDDGRMTRHLTPIRWRRNFVWGDPEFVWGNPDCVWGGVGLIEQWRRFPAGGLRLSYLQVVITNGYSPVTNSDIDGTATFDGTTNTIVLDDQVNNAWPEDIVGYRFRVANDNYTKEYEVEERIDDFTVKVIDSESLLPTGSYAWEIWGFKKGEPLNLLGYNVHWNNMSRSQRTFETGQSGTNS